MSYLKQLSLISFCALSSVSGADSFQNQVSFTPRHVTMFNDIEGFFAQRANTVLESGASVTEEGINTLLSVVKVYLLCDQYSKATDLIHRMRVDVESLDPGRDDPGVYDFGIPEKDVLEKSLPKKVAFSSESTNEDVNSEASNITREEDILEFLENSGQMLIESQDTSTTGKESLFFVVDGLVKWKRYLKAIALIEEYQRLQ